MKATTLAKIDGEFRDSITRYAPPNFTVKMYSSGRKYFLSQLKKDIPSEIVVPPDDLTRTLWGITFRSPIMNAAGMFKEGDCYEMMSKQGAGAYLGGTGTWNARQGNVKNGIHLPFVPYPKSGSSSNFMGLPNKGDEVNSRKILRIERISGTPIGWSVMASPDLEGEAQYEGIVRGIVCYENAGVDFIEWNISCPNVSHGKCESLEDQMSYVERNYLKKRRSNIPIIIKISNDKTVEELPYLLDLMFSKGFHGINIGNTSIQYQLIRDKIHPDERKLFDYFTRTFNGGISGRPLKEKSLELAARAVEYIKAGGPSQEFHVIRTGGIENWNDIMDSERAGISLNQWFTGYFEGFSKYGHEVYKKLYDSRNHVK
jgi:dihydroorotate dehydrogenase